MTRALWPRTLGLLLAATVCLTGCGVPQAEREVEAARAELAVARQMIASMPQTVQQKDQEAERVHAQKLDAEPARLKTALEDSVKKACDAEAKGHDKNWAAVRAEIAQLRKSVESKTKDAARQQAARHAEQIAKLRAQLEPLRQRIDTLAQKLRRDLAAASDQELNKTRAKLANTAKRLGDRTAKIETELAQMAKTLKDILAKLVADRP